MSSRELKDGREDLSRSERECSPGVLRRGQSKLGKSGWAVEFPGKHGREFWTLVEGLGLGTAILRRDAGMLDGIVCDTGVSSGPPRKQHWGILFQFSPFALGLVIFSVLVLFHLNYKKNL